MNMKNETLEQTIARLTKQKEASDKVKGLIGPELETLLKLNGDVTDAKNAADTMTTAKAGIWETVFAATVKIHDATEGAKETREAVFTDALADFLIVPPQADGKPGKLTTVGQYASTARKLLVELVTKRGDKLESYADKSVADVRKAFRKQDDIVLLNDASEAGKRIRYVIKHGTKEEKAELAAVFSLVTDLYNPVKARKDANSKANKAQQELNANKQNHPTVPTVVETVAAELEQDNAVPAVEQHDDAPADKQAAAV